jgi:hypothetical protein
MLSSSTVGRPRGRPLTPATKTAAPIRHRIPDFFRGLSVRRSSASGRETVSERSVPDIRGLVESRWVRSITAPSTVQPALVSRERDDTPGQAHGGNSPLMRRDRCAGHARTPGAWQSSASSTALTTGHYFCLEFLRVMVDLVGTPEGQPRSPGPGRQRPRALGIGTCATAAASCAASPSDGTPNTAVAPPCNTTQSSTPSAARNSCQPCASCPPPTPKVGQGRSMNDAPALVPTAASIWDERTRDS